MLHLRHEAATVGPFIHATARHRHHVITSQLTVAVLVATVHAEIPVTRKQRFVAQRWCRVVGLRVDAAVACNDAVHVNRASLAGRGADATIDTKCQIPETPYHELACIQTHGFLPRDPIQWLTCDVQSQDSWYTHELGRVLRARVFPFVSVVLVLMRANHKEI